jgi:glucose/arabinose dehydrogenase
MSTDAIARKSACVAVAAWAALLGCSGDMPAETASEVPSGESEALVLPDGFSATVFHEGIGLARHMAVRDNGDVYAMTRAGGSSRPDPGPFQGIVAMRDTDGDGQADEVQGFSDIRGTGIAFENGMLYAADDVTVYRFRFDGNELLPSSDPEVLVEGFEPQRQHASKSITLDGEGNLYVNIGAPSNSCQEDDRTPGSRGSSPCPLLQQYGGIWRFDAGRIGQTRQADGEHFASGLRNVVALEWNSRLGALYAVQHGRDQLDFLFPELFEADDNAQRVAEEMHRIEAGGEYGWPYTYYDAIAGRRVVAPEYGGDGEKTPPADSYPDPLVAFPAHWAPNDLVFYDAEQFPERYRGGAFIAFHGSWNRAPLPQEGYNVTFVPLGADGAAAGDWTVFAEGFADREVANPSDARARPTGLAVAPDGSLYVSDSVRGRIWRISYQGS